MRFLGQINVNFCLFGKIRQNDCESCTKGYEYCLNRGRASLKIVFSLLSPYFFINLPRLFEVKYGCVQTL